MMTFRQRRLSFPLKETFCGVLGCSSVEEGATIGMTEGAFEGMIMFPVSEVCIITKKKKTLA
jgi:hypothetical protein